MRYEDIKVGGIYFEMQHRVKVLAKINDVDQFGNSTPAIEVEYINQPDYLRYNVLGSGNLRDIPLHCLKCKVPLIDDIPLKTCENCTHVICPDSKCRKCHCGTPWGARRIK